MRMPHTWDCGSAKSAVPLHPETFKRQRYEENSIGLSSSFNGTLDEILSALESGKPAEVAVEKVGITFNTNDEAVKRFLQWVQESGTKYNHQYGLLNLR